MAGTNDSTVARYFSLVLLLISFLFVVAALPKILARCSSSSSSIKTSPGLQNRPTSYPSHGRLPSTITLLPSVPLMRDGPLNPPRHRSSSWESRFHPFSFYLHNRFIDFKWGQLAVFVMYGTMVFVALFVKAHPAFSVRRAGWIAVAQYPWVFCLAAKNNLLGPLLGISYERWNYVHRWIGKCIFVATLFHVLGYVVIWTQRGTLSTSAARSDLYSAWVAFGAMCLIVIFSLPVVRRRTYELFWASHWIGYIILLIAVTVHVDSTIFYNLASGLILLLDHAIRILKSSYTVAYITPLPDMNCVKIEIPSMVSGWRAGQHVRLRVLHPAFRRYILGSPHPFTIASAPGTPSLITGNVESTRGLTLYIQKTTKRSWTGRLFDLAKKMNTTDPESTSTTPRSIKVLVEGPYGGGHTVFSAFSAAFIVAGGSGVTYALSILEELMSGSERGCSHVKMVHFVWIIQDPASLQPLFSNFCDLLARSNSLLSSNGNRQPTLKLKINVHYSRASENASSIEQNFLRRLPHRMNVKPGRPDFELMMDELVDRTINGGHRSTTRPNRPRSSLPALSRKDSNRLMTIYAGGLQRSASTRPAQGGFGARDIVVHTVNGPKVEHEVVEAHEIGLSRSGTASTKAKYMDASDMSHSTTLPSKAIGGPQALVSKPKGLLIAVCGPVGLCDDLRASQMCISSEQRKQIGGIEFHEETFLM